MSPGGYVSGWGIWGSFRITSSLTLVVRLDKSITDTELPLLAHTQSSRASRVLTGSDPMLTFLQDAGSHNSPVKTWQQTSLMQLQFDCYCYYTIDVISDITNLNIWYYKQRSVARFNATNLLHFGILECWILAYYNVINKLLQAYKNVYYYDWWSEHEKWYWAISWKSCKMPCWH